jgi:anti-anti-sigma regulatory factor
VQRGASTPRDGTPTTTRIGSALVVTLPFELDDDALRGLRVDLLDRVRRARVRSVVLEASGLELIDAGEFEQLAAVARGAAWLGARTLLVGLSPGIVAYLVDAGADTSAFEPHASLDDALATLGASPGRAADAGENGPRAP